MHNHIIYIHCTIGLDKHYQIEVFESALYINQSLFVIKITNVAPWPSIQQRDQTIFLRDLKNE